MNALPILNKNQLYGQTTYIRKKYGYASINTITNCKNAPWILNNLHSLPPSDVALLVEYERDEHIRAKVLQRFQEITSSEKGLNIF